MRSYICITHALGNETEAERLSDTLIAYGFSCRRVHEATEPVLRARTLFGAAGVLALTSMEAHEAATVADDLARLLQKGFTPLCVSLGDNPIDDRFCNGCGRPGEEGNLDCIPYPVGDHPDKRTVATFIHTLLIGRLITIEHAFSRLRCRRDEYGCAVIHAAEARRGDARAAYALGCAYEGGIGVPILEEEAAAWITRAADQGDADAQLHLGELCLSGWGVEPDEKRALALFSAVAERGDRRGEYRLGLCYLNGVGVVTDPMRAVHHLRRAARWGYPPALFRLALLLRDGLGVPADPRVSLRYLYEACRAGAAAEAAEVAHLSAAFDEDVSTVEDVLTDAAFFVEDTEDGVDLSTLRALSDLIQDTPTRKGGGPDATASAPAYPPPPALYGAYGSLVGRHSTLRARCPRLFASTRRRSPTPRSFSRAQYAVAVRPGHAWMGNLTRSGAVSFAGGQAQGHPALHMDRYDVAMGIPFDLSEVAVAIGGLLESGGRSASGEELLPNPTRALVWYRYALRRGNPEALFRLSEAYRRGHGVLADEAFAVELYRISADWGDPRGQFALAVALERGIGIEPNTAEAIRHYEHAASAGYPPAQNNLGGCYEYGIGVAQNILVAVEWYTRAAGAGSSEAQCRLGLCYECGRGVPQDRARAFALYEKAAEGGNSYALYRLGVACDRGDDSFAEEVFSEESDSEDPLSEELPSEDFVEVTSDSAENAEGGDMHARPADRRAVQLSEIVRLWRRAAEGGVADAAYAMAMCYAHGHGVRPDRERAMLYLTDAAEGGCLQAVTRLAICTLEGNGVVPNPSEAVRLLKQAVDMWHERRVTYTASPAPLPPCVETPVEAAADALYMFGYCILEGIGTPSAAENADRRVSDALALFTEAAEMGHVGAYILMGDMYAYGILPLAEKPTEEITNAEREARGEARAAHGKEMARLCCLRAVRLSSARRGKPCPLADEDFARAVVESECLLPTVPDAPLCRGGLLASGVDGMQIRSIAALLTLAGAIMDGRSEYSERSAVRTASDDGTPTSESDPHLLWERAWLYLADAAEQGSSEARVGLARCAYFGRGTEKSESAALRYLQEAVEMPSCCVHATMWLGDFCRTGWGSGECRIQEADAAYLRGLSVKPSGSEVGPYILTKRKDMQKRREIQARADLLYRLATLRAVYLPGKVSDTAAADTEQNGERREYFSYFADAVLLGHAAALRDWARIYAYERVYPAASAPAPTAGCESPKTGRTLSGFLSRKGRRKRRVQAEPAGRDHQTWLADYYTVLWPKPRAFEYALYPDKVVADLPAHMVCTVTSDMEANALNYLGDCFFEGHGIGCSFPAAVCCFREVADKGWNIPKSAEVPMSIVWSQYSLAWCLLRGKGTPRNEAEAVRLLNLATRSTHPEACFLLARCYEEGIGVDKVDVREAIRFYRRAARQGHPEAPVKVREMEVRLGALAEQEERRRRQDT